jgi:pilus assembly protein Flp/PilA
MKLVLSFWENESGATSIEYALIATFIGLVIITAVTEVGSQLKVPFSKVSSAL